LLLAGGNPWGVVLFRHLDVPNLPLGYTQRQSDVSPAQSLNRDTRMTKPRTDDEWLTTLGINKCLSCGVLLGKGTKYVWQGRNRWCEKCFWGDGKESDIANIPAESDETD
jgi:hypothetical protein